MARRESVTGTPEAVRVYIYDQEYSLRGQLDPAYIRQLAQYVDAKMRFVASRMQTVDSLRAAVLAAMNIADDYHQLKEKYEAVSREVDQKVDECTAVLDRLLELRE
jgi:cell division protein ZapA